MSNVLLVDTNFSSGPIYDFLIQEGHNVTVVGSNPTDALAKSADDYVQLDYSNIKRTKQLVKDRNIDFVIPGCNDRSYMVCSEINEDGRFLGIDSLETAEIINNKEKFRALMIKHDLPSPRVLLKHEIGTRWPVIVKPVDAFSGRGVTIVHKENGDQLVNAIDLARQASRTKMCIVEDYVVGQLYSHTAFIQNNKIIEDHIVEEHGTANPFVVDTSRVTFDFPETILEKIRQNITLIATKLSLKDGLVHTQFIKNDKQYWLIEVTRRCPGDLYSQLIEFSTGLNYVENYTRPFLGLHFNLNCNSQKKWVIRHTLTKSTDYTIESLSFTLPLTIKKWVPLSVTGDRLRASPYGRIGIIFLEEESEERFNKIYSATINRKLYTVE
jgi:biotin carboxylase